MCLSLFLITKFIDVWVEKLINCFSNTGGHFKMLFKLTKIVYRRRATSGGEGSRGARSPLPFLENRKKVPWFWKNMSCLFASMDYNSHLKCNSKSILEKKRRTFFLRALSFVYHPWNIYRRAPIPRKLPGLEKILVTRLYWAKNTLCHWLSISLPRQQHVIV